MKTVHKKMLFTAIVGFSAGIAALLFHSRTDIEALSLLANLFYIFFCLLAACRILSVSTRISQAILPLVLLFGTSPRRLQNIAPYLPSECLTDNFFVIYACFAFAIIAPITEYIVAVNDAKLRNSTQSELTSCHACGYRILPHEVFCPNCHKISPKLIIALRNQPNLRYLDYVLANDRSRLRCPFCQRSYGSFLATPISNELSSPIQRCRCGNYIMNNHYIEWSVVPSGRKIKYFLFGDSFKLIFGLLLLYSATTLFSGEHIACSLLLLFCALVLRCIWLKVITVFDIHASQERLRVNPEYPKILAHMGYKHLDAQYKNKTP